MDVYDGSVSRQAEVINLSSCGAFIALCPTVPLGTGVSFQLDLGEHSLAVRGHVRWTRSLAAGVHSPVGSGIEFFDPDGVLADAVLDALQSVRAARR